MPMHTACDTIGIAFCNVGGTTNQSWHRMKQGSRRVSVRLNPDSKVAVPGKNKPASPR